MGPTAQQGARVGISEPAPGRITVQGELSFATAREALIDPVDKTRRSSLEPYATYRSAYQQRRQADIENHLGPAVTSSTGAFLPTPAEKRLPDEKP